MANGADGTGVSRSLPRAVIGVCPNWSQWHALWSKARLAAGRRSIPARQLLTLPGAGHTIMRLTEGISHTSLAA